MERQKAPDRQEALERLLRSFEVYYDVNRAAPARPFAAEAEFSLYDEQYFLVRSARISEADSREFVYFAAEEHLDEARLAALDEAAWQNGLAKVRPHAHHRNSDVVLIVLADRIDDAAMERVRALRHYQSYLFTFRGWSHYRLIAVELSTGRIACNRQGESLRKLVGNILK